MTAHLITPQLTPQTTDFFPGYDLPPVPLHGTRVILLSHGHSTFSDTEQSQFHPTPQGIATTQDAGRFLARCPIDAVYASPLKQAQSTLATLLPYLKAPKLKGLTASPLLQGLDLSVKDLYQRVQQFWQEVLPRHQGQTLLVVSHGDTKQTLINTAWGLSMQQHHALQQTHNSITVLDFDEPSPAHGQLQILNLSLGDRLPQLNAGEAGLRLLLLPCHANQSPDPDLAFLLKETKVQAAVVENWRSQPSYPCHQGVKALLRHNPETVVLSVQRSQFWQQWQMAIGRSLQANPHAELTTVLAVAQPEPLKQFVQALLQLPNGDLNLQPNTLSVVHFSNAQERPTLQAMNLAPVPNVA